MKLHVALKFLFLSSAIISELWSCSFWVWLFVVPPMTYGSSWPCFSVFSAGPVSVCFLMEMFCDLQKCGASWTGGMSRRVMTRFSKHSWTTRSTAIHRSRWLTAQSVEQFLNYSHHLSALPYCTQICPNFSLTVLYLSGDQNMWKCLTQTQELGLKATETNGFVVECHSVHGSCTM